MKFDDEEEDVDEKNLDRKNLLNLPFDSIILSLLLVCVRVKCETVRRKDMIIAPINFAQISPGVYRSGYPNKKNFSFLQKLKLKCVLYIGTLPKKDDDLTFHRANLEFYEKEGIRFLHLDVGENREPFLQMNHKVVSQVVKLLLGSFLFLFFDFSFRSENATQKKNTQTRRTTRY